MKIKFKVPNESLLAAKLMMGNDSDFLQEECSYIEISELNKDQLDLIKSITPETSDQVKNKDNIPVLNEPGLVVKHVEQVLLNQQYKLRIYLEPLAIIKGKLSNPGNFEFLFGEEKDKKSAEGYLQWRQQFCELFPDMDLMKIFSLEEKIGCEKGKLGRFKMGVSIRAGMGFFDVEEDKCIEDSIHDAKENIQQLKQSRI